MQELTESSINKSGDMAKQEHLKGNATERIKRIEDHCGVKIQDRRLRMHIQSEMQRIIDAHNQLRSGIDQVMMGHKTYDPSTQEVRKRRKDR